MMKKYRFDFVLARYSGAAVSILLGILIWAVQWNACEMKIDIRELRNEFIKFNDKIIGKENYYRDLQAIKIDIESLRKKCNGKSIE
jgi:hypothetical protein